MRCFCVVVCCWLFGCCFVLYSLFVDVVVCWYALPRSLFSLFDVGRWSSVVVGCRCGFVVLARCAALLLLLCVLRFLFVVAFCVGVVCYKGSLLLFVVCCGCRYCLSLLSCAVSVDCC